jgi:hypothetical protein
MIKMTNQEKIIFNMLLHDLVTGEAVNPLYGPHSEMYCKGYACGCGSRSFNYLEDDGAFARIMDRSIGKKYASVTFSLNIDGCRCTLKDIGDNVIHEEYADSFKRAFAESLMKLYKHD